jgi:hypothetical protein
MSIETTTPGAPIPAPPAHWRPGSDRPARRVPGAQLPERGQSEWPLNLDLDPAAARRVGAQIQSAGRRAERDGIQRSSRGDRILRILDAANALAAVSADNPDDEIGRTAFRLVHDLRELAARFVTVPAASDIRPEVPGVAA